MISFNVSGDSKVEQYLQKTSLYLKHRRYIPFLERCGQEGIEALRNATPKDSGLTAESWTYDIVFDGQGLTVEWSNSNVEKGWFNVALYLQYGHGTKNGGYVEGIDYINPALRPIFDKMAERLWREVAE